MDEQPEKHWVSKGFDKGMRVVADPRTRDEARKIGMKLWTVVMPLVLLWIAVIALMGVRLGWVASVLGVVCTSIGIVAQMVNRHLGDALLKIYHLKLLPQPQLPALVSAKQLVLTMEQGDVIEEAFSDPAFRDASYAVNGGSAEIEVPALRVLVPAGWTSLSEDDQLDIAEQLDEDCAAMVAEIVAEAAAKTSTDTSESTDP